MTKETAKRLNKARRQYARLEAEYLPFSKKKIIEEPRKSGDWSRAETAAPLRRSAETGAH